MVTDQREAKMVIYFIYEAMFFTNVCRLWFSKNDSKHSCTSMGCDSDFLRLKFEEIEGQSASTIYLRKRLVKFNIWMTEHSNHPQSLKTCNFVAPFKL